MIIQVNPIIDYKTIGMCLLPYSGHKNGCPNWHKKAGCPPTCGLYDKTYDITQPVYAIINEFDLGSHVLKMKTAHPNWSDRQTHCCLYWQPSARKQLVNEIDKFKLEHPEYEVNRCPEAMGVQITQTLKNAGIILEWPPKNIVRQVALAAIKKETI